MTKNAQLKTTIIWLLAITTGAVLLLHSAQAEFATIYLETYLPELLIYGILTAFALVFGVRLSDGELSVAHFTGMMAFLSLPVEVLPWMLWAMFGGGLAGGITIMIRNWRQPDEGWTTLVFTTATTTLSFYAAARFYVATGAPLPVETLQGPEMWANITALMVYALVYVLMYFAIFVLKLAIIGRPVITTIRKNIQLILIILLLPIPFAIVGADVADRQNSSASFLIILGAVTLIILGLHALSRAELQSRRQVDELRSLAAATQAMRGHLNLDTLLQTIYLQVANLLDIDSFRVVLYDSSQSNLTYPLVIRQGITLDTTVVNYMAPDKKLIDQVLKTGAATLLDKSTAQNLENQGLPPLYPWMGTPLLASKRVLGALIVTAPNSHRHFSADDLRLLTIISASASIAIENALLYTQKSAYAEQMATLNQINALLTGSLSPDSVLDTIISSASAISDATAVSVYFQNGNDRLKLVRSAGLSEIFNQRPPEPLIKKDLEKVTESHLKPPPVVVQNIHEGEQDQSIKHIIESEGQTAWVELPLKIDDDQFGVLVLYFDKPLVSSDEQLSIWMAFANQAGQSIKNAQLFKTTDEALEQRIEQLQALAAISQMLNATINANQIYDLVLGYTADIVNATRAVIARRATPNDPVQITAQRGYPSEALSDPSVLLNGLSGRALAEGLPFLTGDASTDAHHHALVPDTVSILATPIQKGNQTIGVLMLESDRRNAFTDEDRNFVSQVVNQAVIAMDNAQLFQRVSRARDRLQVIVDAMHDGMILIDDRRRIMLANPAVQLIGFTSVQLTGKPISDLMNDPDVKFVQHMGFDTEDDLQSVLDSLGTSSWRDQPVHLYEATSQKGIHYIQRQIIPIRSENSPNVIGVLLVFYNKTEEKELERARESLSQMIVHDLRSPLTAVTTSLRLLQELVPADSDFKPLVEKTTKTSRRAIRKVLMRVDSLLDISKMESGELNLHRELNDLATIADSVCVELSPLAHELNVRLLSEIDDTIPQLYIDGDKVERTMLNLVDNALKYAPDSSTIRLRAHPPQPGSNLVQVDVIDQGPGVPEQYKQKLFDRFIQIEGRQIVRQGVGLGLTFCKMVTEAHGGCIWINDNPDGGSIFSFSLPVAQKEPSNNKKGAHEKEGSARPQEKTDTSMQHN